MTRQDTLLRLRDLMPETATPLAVVTWLEHNEMALLWMPVEQSSQPTLWKQLFRHTEAPGWDGLWKKILAHPVGRAYVCEHFRDTLCNALRAPDACARPLLEALGADVANDWWTNSLRRAAMKRCGGDEHKALSEFLKDVLGENRLNLAPDVLSLLGQWGWLDVNAPMRFSIVRNSANTSLRAQAPVGLMLLWLDQMHPTELHGRWQKPNQALMEATLETAARLGWVAEASPLSGLAGFDLRPHEQVALNELGALARQKRLDHTWGAPEDEGQAKVSPRL